MIHVLAHAPTTCLHFPTVSNTELDTDWMHPWIGLGRLLEKLGWIGLDCGEWMMYRQFYVIDRASKFV